MSWDFFRDQIWTFVGVIIGMIALIIPIITYFLQKTKKNLSYEILSNNSILSDKDKVEGKFKILYDEKVLDDISICEIKFSNTGSQSIHRSDFEKTLDLKFVDDTEIFSIDIISVEPENLNVKCSIESNVLKIEPLLLNVKDSFVVKLLLSNVIDKKDIIIDVRIKDVKKITKVKEPTYSLFFLIIGIVTTLLGVSKLESLSPKVITPWTNQKILAVILIAIGYLLIITTSLRKNNLKILKDIFKRI